MNTSGETGVTLGSPDFSVWRHHQVKTEICSILWAMVKYLQLIKLQTNDVTFSLSRKCLNGTNIQYLLNISMLALAQSTFVHEYSTELLAGLWS